MNEIEKKKHAKKTIGANIINKKCPKEYKRRARDDWDAEIKKKIDKKITWKSNPPVCMVSLHSLPSPFSV